MSDISQKIVLFDIDYTLFDTDNFKSTGLTSFKAYGEVADVLEEISQIAEMGIISTGEISFQENKLHKAEIIKHFSRENIHIALDKEEILQETLSKYSSKRIFLVDDKIAILKKAKEVSPSVFTIWVKRGPFVEIMKDVEFTPDAVVESLETIVETIRDNISN